MVAAADKVEVVVEARVVAADGAADMVLDRAVEVVCIKVWTGVVAVTVA